MKKIRKLPPQIVSQIAAGEVIERPAYAVKELVENAIDAKASQISIDIEDSGLKNITVSDNGIGMEKNDLLESFKPHTTSKIYAIEDLHSISSLGFRGEALASIASISEMIIQSKLRNEKTGYEITVSKGVLKSVSAIGMPHGTTIHVNQLFSNVPARKRFLKSEKTEFRHILDIVSNFVLAYPNIEFSLTHNNHEYFKFTKHHTIERRIQELLGKSLFQNLIPIKTEEGYLKIEGFVARPQHSIKGQSKIFTFINKRRVFDNLSSITIKESYKNLLEYGAYPIAIIYLTMPTQMVDVNIHPRKEHVSFIDQENIYATLGKTIEKTLKDNNLTFSDVSWKDGGTKTYLGKTLKDELLREIYSPQKDVEIVQFHNLYLFSQTSKGIMIIDQHAAHEALLFRKLKNLYKKHKATKEYIKLKPPLLLDLSISDSEILLENIDLFSKIGFEIEGFAGGIRVNSVPYLFKDRNIQDLIQELLEETRLGKKIKDIDKRTYRMLSYIACRSAIKGGQMLSKEETKKLAKDLSEEDMTYTCPHGRPVKIEMSLNYLNNMFKR